LGAGNVLTGKVLGKGVVETDFGRLTLPFATEQAKNTRVSLLLRPHELRLGGENAPLHGRVADVRFQQDRYLVRLEGGLDFYHSHPLTVGAYIGLVPQADKIRFLEK
jgi:hypothetical protein